MGQTGCLDPRELKDSSFYLVWGSNMKATRLQSMPALIQARRQGKRVVLIESCAADMEVYCDQTILIRPGTDGALALAMMHVMEEEKPGRTGISWPIGQMGMRRSGKPLPHIPRLGGGGDGHPRRGDRWPVKRIRLGSGSGHHFGKRSLPLWQRGNDHTAHHHVCPGLYRRVGASGRRFGAAVNPGAGVPAWTTGWSPGQDCREKPGRRVNINEIASALTGSRGERKPIRSFYVYGGNHRRSVRCQKGNPGGPFAPLICSRWPQRAVQLTDTATYADILLPATFFRGADRMCTRRTDTVPLGQPEKSSSRQGRVRAIGTPSACWPGPWDTGRSYFKKDRGRNGLRSCWPIPWR
ncbi:MAG: hypothetical protein ACLR0U_02365 [Enterocloster clostridioformis]